ncbi:MAG: DUF4339 domain-containing protein [Planctomycetaceae bacterium]|nr:DUF4339 domain-containing protein [Planctomycetaceae bacterium]
MSDQWYYQTRGQEVGPVSSAVLGDLIASGVLRDGDHVRVANGEWQSLDNSLCERIGVATQSVDGKVPPASENARNPNPVDTSSRELRTAITESQRYLHDQILRRAQQSSRSRRLASPISGEKLSNVLRIPIAVIDAFLALGGHLLSWIAVWLGPFLRSKWTWTSLGILSLICAAYYLSTQILTRGETHAFLSQSVAELRRLRDAEANNEQWATFAQRTSERLQTMIPRLQDAARADDPISMELLFLARDYLPLMLVDARERPSEAERKFDVHMDRVERVYGQNAEGSLTLTDWPVLASLVAGLLILGTATWKWRTS